MNEEIKTDHFKTLNELLKHCKTWIEEEDIWAYERYFEMQCMEVLYNYIVELQQENQSLKDRIEKAIEYMKPRFMNCIDNEKRYFEDNDIQEIYEILKGDK